MADVDDISAAVYGAIAGIVLRGRGLDPRAVVAALDRVQGSLDQVRAYWLERATEYLGETNVRSLQTEPVQVAMADVVREEVGGRYAYKVHKSTMAAKVFERNDWRELKRKYSVRYFVMPDGSEPPEHLTPVIELTVPTRAEVVRLADELHAARADAAIKVDGLEVLYSSSHVSRATNRAGKEYTRRLPAHFLMFKTCWLVTATWERGDDKPPEWQWTGENEDRARSLPEPALRLVVERESVGR